MRNIYLFITYYYAIYFIYYAILKTYKILSKSETLFIIIVTF